MLIFDNLKLLIIRIKNFTYLIYKTKFIIIYIGDFIGLCNYFIFIIYNF
jgi:hypothetical protein